MSIYIPALHRHLGQGWVGRGGVLRRVFTHTLWAPTTPRAPQEQWDAVGVLLTLLIPFLRRLISDKDKTKASKQE